MAKNNTAATNNVIDITTLNHRKVLYNTAMNNANRTGRKCYAYIPIELIEIDGRFQREDLCNPLKITSLAANWDSNKMDAIRVSPHPETYSFSLINGLHRVKALGINGELFVEAEILMGLSLIPDERLIQEAEIFATQNDDEDRLTPIQKHKANMIRKIKENLELDELMQKYDFAYKKNNKGITAIGQLAGFNHALGITRVHGKEMMDNILYLICLNRWNMERLGTSNHVLDALKNLLLYHPDNVQNIVNISEKILKPMTPKLAIAEAMAAYKQRSAVQQLTLYLEDLFCDALGMERVYLIDDLTIERKHHELPELPQAM